MIGASCGCWLSVDIEAVFFVNRGKAGPLDNCGSPTESAIRLRYFQ
jgi:hypothetical protein